MAVALAGCGSDVQFGDVIGGGDGTDFVPVAHITLIAESGSLPSDESTGGIEVKAIVTDANNNAIPNVPVLFAATSGAVVVENNVTGDDGTAAILLNTGGDPSVRTITVGAAAGEKTDTIDIQVVKVPNPVDVRAGVLNGTTFTPGIISIGQSPLAAGGSSALRVDLVDVANGNSLFNTPTGVTFTSPCVTQGLATITSPVDTAGGSANATYQALGCSGDDPITATANVDGASLLATGTIHVTPSGLGAIEFVSATPTTIGIQGTGLPETSTVVFRVRNATGGPVANLPVTFSLNTTVGGITLSPSTGTTDSTGRVQTIVRSGTVHTSVRITATATQNGVTIKSQSDALTITTGIPDQRGVSLSIETFNPNTWAIDGVLDKVTLHATDRYQNPVPDGTAFAFETSEGGIQGSCTTSGGACTVNWVSQNPRHLANPAPDPKMPGTAVILAYAIGEESFTDLNGNGKFDSGEPFDDLAEPFRDDNLSGAYDPTFEEFKDFNSNGHRDDPSGSFTGLLCASNCDSDHSLYVSASGVIRMSDSTPVIDTTHAPSADITIIGGSYTLPNDQPTITINTCDTGNGGGATATLRVVIRDLNDNPMPQGTSISLADEGGDITITPLTSYTVPNTIDASAAGNTYTWSLTDEAFIAGDQFGAITLTVTKDNIITHFQFKLILHDVSPCP